MIHALITGRLHAAPAQRTGKNGQPFTTAKVQVPAGQGRIFASVICFDRLAQQALLALVAGDAVSLAGELTPTVWTDREGATHPALDLVAHQCMSAYAVTRRRQASQQPQQSQRQQTAHDGPQQAAAAMDEARATWGHEPDDVGF